MFFIAPLLAAFGLLAGAGLALGISMGAALLSERVRLGRILGGALVGGLGFAVVMSPFVFVTLEDFLSRVLTVVGSGLFGIMTALGITVPTLISSKRIVVLVGGAVGAALGEIITGALGFPPLGIGPAGRREGGRAPLDRHVQGWHLLV